MPRGKHREGYRRPRTGEKRKQRKPLAWDRAPQELRDAIVDWHRRGESWAAIATLASAKATALKCEALSEKEIRTGFDLRIEQAEVAVAERAAFSERIVAAWSRTDLKQLPKAALNALSDKAFELAQYEKEGDAESAARCLIELNKVLAQHRNIDLAQKKLDVEQQKLDERRQRAAAVSPREIWLAATEELLKKLRTRKDVRAVLDPIQKELVEELSKSAESFAKRIEAQQAG